MPPDAFSQPLKALNYRKLELRWPISKSSPAFTFRPMTQHGDRVISRRKRGLVLFLAPGELAVQFSDSPLDQGEPLGQRRQSFIADRGELLVHGICR